MLDIITNTNLRYNLFLIDTKTGKTFSLIIFEKDVDMENNYWETVSGFCCPECGHLIVDIEGACSFCNGVPIYNRRDIKSLDQIGNTIGFDEEKCLFEITFDDGL